MALCTGAELSVGELTSFACASALLFKAEERARGGPVLSDASALSATWLVESTSMPVADVVSDTLEDTGLVKVVEEDKEEEEVAVSDPVCCLSMCSSSCKVATRFAIAVVW